VAQKICIRKILVPFDNSQNSRRALNTGISFAKTFNSKLVIIYVVYIPPYGGFQRSNADKVNAMMHVKKLMSFATTLCKKNDVICESVVKHGDIPGDLIVKFINKSSNKIDLVVIGSRGKSLTHKIFFGSTSNHVLHKTKKTIVIVK
jgi:nucleotide-binding universal stress UspA family protein